MSPDPPRASRAFRTLLPKLLLSAGTLAFALLVAEVVLRLCGFGSLEIYEPDPLLYWRLKPGQSCFTKVGHKPVHINSRGTRGPEFAEPKPPGTVRVLSLGDSRTFGWGLSDGETYSALLGQMLQSRLGGGTRVEVINAGVNAWSFAQMQACFQQCGLGYQPDVAILAEANLWTQFSGRADPEFARAFMGRVRLKNLLRRSALYHWFIEVKLQAFYERHRTKFIPVDPARDELFKAQQRSDPDACFRDEIARFCRLAISNGIKPVMVFLPTLDELRGQAPPRTLRIKEAVGRDLGLAVVDTRDCLRALAPPPYLESDPVHLDTRGNEAVARRLTEAILPLVAPGAPPSGAGAARSTIGKLEFVNQPR